MIRSFTLHMEYYDRRETKTETETETIRYQVKFRDAKRIRTDGQGDPSSIFSFCTFYPLQCHSNEVILSLYQTQTSKLMYPAPPKHILQLNFFHPVMQLAPL
jgi:hypothetical protein